MQYKKYTKQGNISIQGLRSFKDTLPKRIKKVIAKKGHIYSETINNWKYIVGENLFKVCYPKSFKNSNKFNVSTLLIIVKRGHEIDLEYSRNEIIDKMNTFFVTRTSQIVSPPVTIFDLSEAYPCQPKMITEQTGALVYRKRAIPLRLMRPSRRVSIGVSATA